MRPEKGSAKGESGKEARDAQACFRWESENAFIHTVVSASGVLVWPMCGAPRSCTLRIPRRGRSAFSIALSQTCAVPRTTRRQCLACAQHR
eukprot:1810742-Rhodomonas_salina.5